MKMAPVFVWSRRKDKNIIDVGNTEGEVVKDIIPHALKGGPGVSKTKAGDGGLQDVGGIHGDLIVSLQEVQLREDFRPVKIGPEIGDVGERVMIRFHQHVESPVVAAGAYGTVFFGDDVEMG